MNIECTICYEKFPQDIFVICRTCSHGICNGCFCRLTQQKCPFCRTYYPGYEFEPIPFPAFSSAGFLEDQLNIMFEDINMEGFGYTSRLFNGPIPSTVRIERYDIPDNEDIYNEEEEEN